MGRKASLFILALILSSVAFAQQGFNPYQPDREIKIKRSPIRAFLNKFSVMFSSGYGATFYKTEWPGVDILQHNNRATLLESYSVSGSQIDYTGIDDWTFSPISQSGQITMDETTALIYADSVTPMYSGLGKNIPLNLSLHLDINRFRIGVGYTFEFQGLKKLKPESEGDLVYKPVMKSTTARKFYVLLGGKFYHWKGWDYHAEIQIGKVAYGPRYDKSLLSNGLYFNLGIPMEFEFSEYFWFFVRPSFEFRNYSLTMPVQLPDGAIPESVTYKQPTLYVNVGFRYKFPEIRRCPVKACHTQLKHIHSNKEYRGQPFYKVQNPGTGELEHWRHLWDWLKK